MDRVDKLVYDFLIKKTEDGLLSSLLAFYYYQDKKIKIVGKYFSKHDKVPSEEFLKEVIFYEVLESCRRKARHDVHFYYQTEANNFFKKHKKKSKFWASVFSSFLARVIFEILAILITILLIYFGFDLANILNK